MVIEAYAVYARAVHIKRPVQPPLIVAAQLHSCVLYLGVTLSYALFRAACLLASATLLCCFLIGTRLVADIPSLMPLALYPL
jgi:hypothetical protein